MKNTLIIVTLAIISSIFFLFSPKKKLNEQDPYFLRTSDVFETYREGHTEQALKLLKSNIQNLRDLGEMLEVVDHYNLIGYINRSLLNYDEFYTNSKKSYETLLTVKNPPQNLSEIVSLQYIRSFYEKGDYRKAKEIFAKHIDLDELKCSQREINQRFLIMEYAYMLGLRDKSWKQPVQIYNDCLKGIEKFEDNLIPHWRKKIYFLGSLIEGAENAQTDQLTKYLELVDEGDQTEKLVSQLLVSCIAKRNKQPIKVNIATSDSLYDNIITPLSLLKNDQTIPGGYGHWSLYCR